jgi:hypothetical protein
VGDMPSCESETETNAIVRSWEKTPIEICYIIGEIKWASTDL